MEPDLDPALQGLGNVVDFNSQPGWYNSVNLAFSNIVHESAHNANDGGFDVSVTGIPADRGVRLYDSNNNIISTIIFICRRYFI